MMLPPADKPASQPASQPFPALKPAFSEKTLENRTETPPVRLCCYRVGRHGAKAQQGWVVDELLQVAALAGCLTKGGHHQPVHAPGHQACMRGKGKQGGPGKVKVPPWGRLGPQGEVRGEV